MGVALTERGALQTIRVDGQSFGMELLLPADHIQERVEEMGSELAMRYDERGEVHVLGVLNGALHFASDLRRTMQRANPRLDITSDQVKVSSYAGTQSSGVIRFQGPPPEGLTDKHVLVVDDILDTGLTLRWLMGCINEQQPASLEVAVALKKDNPERSTNLLDDTALHAGFEIGNDFVIGYGLDVNGRHRDLDSIYRIAPVVLGQPATPALS